ncbi:MAG TPA: class I SAM-dependent methyltransferase [Chitinophagaceae bacterium]|nr:class I SAM-dependent methyltransferase [Chitinophagaceae bacterium]
MIGNRYEYDTMAKCEQELWWYRCLHDLTLLKIKTAATVAHPRVLDAGCGTGGLLLKLKENGYSNLAGFDLSPDAVTAARATSGIDVQLLDITALNGVYAPNSFDVITSHDIVCFLPEGQDKVAVDNLLSLLKPGGILLMNLPALKAFYGTHDVALGMQRRYSKKSIRVLVNGSAEILELIYWPFLLSPPIFLARTAQKIELLFKDKEKIVSDVKMPSSHLNNVFYKMTSFENRNIKIKPWGSSLFSVLQKPL